MLCFAHVCRDLGHCVALDCHQHIPPRAKQMIGQKLKSVKKDPRASTENDKEGLAQCQVTREATEHISMQATEQCSHASTSKKVDSTWKDDAITPKTHRESEAESTLGSDGPEGFVEMLTSRYEAVASPGQQPTLSRLRSTPKAKTSPMVRRASEAGSTEWKEVEEVLTEVLADAGKGTPS